MRGCAREIAKQQMGRTYASVSGIRTHAETVSILPWQPDATDQLACAALLSAPYRHITACHCSAEGQGRHHCAVAAAAAPGTPHSCM